MDALTALCSAIATAEGFYSNNPNVPPRRDHNPGDLRDAPWLAHPKHDGGFWQAESDAQGIAGMFHQVALDVARGWTLRQIIHSWAPPSDGNDTENYTRETLRRIGAAFGAVALDVPYQQYLHIERIP